MRGPEFFGQFRGVAGQTDMAEYVSLTDQTRMFITLPSVPEQQSIAHILGTLDDKIELNRRMNATLEAMARALFRPQWTGQNRPFVDTSKPAISGGPRLELRSTSRRPLLATCLPARQR